MTFGIVSDVGCDLSEKHLADWGVSAAPMALTVAGETFAPTGDSHARTLYNALRRGENAFTAAVSPEAWKSLILPFLEKGQDVLVLPFSSGLSGTCRYAQLAAEELAEQFPQRQIRVVDSLCASLGQGLLVYYACQRRQAGDSLEETARWCEENRLRIHHWFTVDDLKYLKRGGRLSAGAALAGSLLNIKPVLHMAEDGKLYPVRKVRGRKAALHDLADRLAPFAEENTTVFISHGDCAPDAELLARILRERYRIPRVEIGYIGGVIGAHAGPGTLALFFLADRR